MRLRYYLTPLMLVLIAALLASCSPYALVSSQSYNGVSLRDFSTFRIVTPDDADSAKLPPTMTIVTYYNIAAAIREQMTERGFREDPSSPLLINLGLTVRHGVTTEPLMLPTNYYPYPGPPPPPGVAPWFMYPRQYYWGPSYYDTGAQVVTGIYREGVLTMDFIDVPRKLPVYSASVATLLNGSSGGFRNLKGIAEAVQTLFSEFPVPVEKK